MAEIKIDLKKYEGQEIKIKIQNGVAIIEGEEKGKYPENGYYATTFAEIEEVKISSNENWKTSEMLNVYPNKNHAILFGQVFAPLLVKHYVLTGGYWEENCEYSVFFDPFFRIWKTYHDSDESTTLGICEFPFPNQELAEQFLSENREQLNKIIELWHQK